MNAPIVFFTQPGCLSCEFMKFFLEAKEIIFEERDISADPEARRQMTERHGSRDRQTLASKVHALGFLRGKKVMCRVCRAQGFCRSHEI